MDTQTAEQQKEQKEAATNIIAWLGGIGKLRAMVGAYDTFSTNEENGDHGWIFKFKGSKVANICKITLNYALDTYTVEFMKFRSMNCKPVSKFEDVYGESLKSLFESEMKLYLSL